MTPLVMPRGLTGDASSRCVPVLYKKDDLTCFELHSCFLSDDALSPFVKAPAAFGLEYLSSLVLHFRAILHHTFRESTQALCMSIATASTDAAFMLVRTTPSWCYRDWRSKQKVLAAIMHGGTMSALCQKTAFMRVNMQVKLHTHTHMHKGVHGHLQYESHIYVSTGLRYLD